VLARARVPAAVFLVAAAVYVVVLGDRATGPSPDNHFVHLANSFLHGQLSVVGNQPPGTNDWACYDVEEHGPCPPNRYRFPEGQQDRYRWYVSFPPMPAVVILPAVAAFGLDTPDRLFWAILAGLAPALLYVLLRRLRETERSNRTPKGDLVLTALFAFGTVYFFTAVQGTVWFAAHVVAVPLTVLYVLFSLDAKRPALAGLVLGLAFATRPTTAFLVPFFLIEAMRVARPADAPEVDGDAIWWRRVVQWVRGVEWKPVLRSVGVFAGPVVLVGLVMMWMNQIRFEDPFEFGHTYLQIRWRPRIEKWGLFNYHYFGKNLAVFVASLPWLSAAAPYVKISRHGLALWVTTPNLLQAAWPRKVTVTMLGLYVATLVVMVLDLCYQNSGWVQFGYRFGLDYMVLVFALLALGLRRLGPGFFVMMAFAIAINLFGALTFDRAWEYYDDDPTQNVIFQPD